MTPFPEDVWSIAILLAIITSLFLAVYLPWKRGYSASMVVSASILIISALVFLIEIVVSDQTIVRDLGFYPRDIVDNYSIYRFLTPIYIHGDFLHLISNFLPLFFLGMQLESKLGWKRFLLLFFGSGIIAHCLVLSLSPVELLEQSMRTVSIGASGAVFGLLGGYWFLYPKDEVVFPLIIIKKWPISLIFIIYGGLETVLILFGGNDNISHVAHLGGLFGAFPVAALIRPPEKGEVEQEKISEEGLRKLTRTNRQRRLLKRVMDSDEKEVRDAWLEELFKTLKCPKCGHAGMDYNGKAGMCTSCGYRIRP